MSLNKSELRMFSTPFMTIQDVADLLRVSKATVRTWIRNEELRAVKLEREFRIAKVDLKRFVEARATIASPETDNLSCSKGDNDDTQVNASQAAKNQTPQ